ncbi:MAG: metal ABC transporter ATP-binding protein [Patescibacteria group bacterium]
MPFLEVKNLSVSLGSEPVLERVSFSVDQGETVALLGPNGAGKTTLLRALLGDIPSGGQVIWHVPPRIGYVPQNIDFDRTVPLTVEELFIIYARSKRPFFVHDRATENEIQKTLALVGAEHLLHKHMGAMSYGELQRVLIARAAFDEPNILFLDEPTANIDPSGERAVYPLMRDMARTLSIASIFISHDVNVVYDFADTVVCINKRMLCAGAPRAVLTEPKLRELYGGGVALYEHHH